ncbi:putative Y2126 family protein [Octadecabacter antarcticus 307]|uniref:Putative Y2126 family protein n=1 Tax=Octadecabacter antarcticus 307 TaxID=391626 RepID=M9R9D1_9RHOB|nr:hypothetical protein [Octadecabacter antarcticus]AGI68398.1 putative Y2126 family protein [Octadecabacter antarcticus 307]
MRHLFIAIAVTFSFAGAAQACPDYTIWGTNSYNSSGDQLYSPRSFNITAGGENYLPNCGFSSNETGYFTTTPDFSFDLGNMNGYQLVISVVSNCDAALLVNSADTQWFYDDDSNGQSDPRLDLINLGSGVLDVWVGTYNGAYCDATLTLETF